MENKTLEFARVILDNHVDYNHDYNRGSTDYFCIFCDTDSISKWAHEDDSNIVSELNHSDDCPVISAKKYIHTLIIEE